MKIRAFARAHDIIIVLIPKDAEARVTCVHAGATETTGAIFLMYEEGHFNLLKVQNEDEDCKQSVRDLLRVVEEPTEPMRAGGLTKAEEREQDIEEDQFSLREWEEKPTTS